jgi:hypothetical protein
MSDQSGRYYDRLGRPRELRADEHAIIVALIKGGPYEHKVLGELSGLAVQDMPDGGMGSIKFCTETAKEPVFGKEIAEGAFQDEDGVPVSVTLNLDDAGNLFELDVFKANGAPLISYPDPKDFEIIERHGKLGFPPR